MKVELIKSWTNGDNKYEVGTEIGLEDADAQKLISEGIAIDVVAKAAEEKRIDAEDKRIEVLIEKALTAALKATAPKKDVSVLEPMVNRIDPTGGFNHFGDFAREVYKASGPSGIMGKKLLNYVQKTQLSTIAQESDDEQGGFLVPVEFRAELLDRAREGSAVYGNAREIPMARNRLEIPSTGSEDHSTTPPTISGGTETYWTDEGEQKTRKKPLLEKVQLNLHKLVGFCAVTDELLEDSAISIPSVINPLFEFAIRWRVDDAMINGNGIGLPLGILNAPALVAVARAGAGLIAVADVSNMLARFDPKNEASCYFLANRRTLPQLIGMTTGTVPVFQPSVREKPGAYLFGYPIIFTEKCSALGVQGDIILTDLSQYLVGVKQGGIKVATSMHLYFDYDAVAFRFVLRIDGQPAQRTATTEKDGVTVSPYVTLAA